MELGDMKFHTIYIESRTNAVYIVLLYKQGLCQPKGLHMHGFKKVAYFFTMRTRRQRFNPADLRYQASHSLPAQPTTALPAGLVVRLG